MLRPSLQVRGYYNAIIDHFDRRLDWQIRREWLSSNVGIYSSMSTLIDELTSPGDEIIFQTPVHHVFRELILAHGRVPIENPLIVENGTYRMDTRSLESVATERGRLFVLCNPHNPVGRVWSPSELLELSTFCMSHDIRVLADEVYFGLIHQGARFTPFAALSAESSMNTVTITSASKSFNLTGLKHSLVISENRALLGVYEQGLKKNNLFYGGSTMGIVATEAPLAHGDAWLDELMLYIAGNFDVLKTRLRECAPTIRLNSPEGTYFAWLDCREWGLTDDGLTTFFDRDAQMIVSAGRPLGGLS